MSLPSWVIFGTADAARQILTSLAAAVITVIGIVFSITIVTLTLASTQFGPRMLRNFIRDRGTQFTLGTFVATFVYATLVLVSIGPGTRGTDFVPHASITVAVGLVTLSMAVLIYFINHIATSIQLPVMIRQLEALTRMMADTATIEQRQLPLRQAAMIQLAGEESIPEAADREDVKRRYDEVLAAAARVTASEALSST